MAENKVLEIEILRFVNFFYSFIAFPYYCSVWRRSCGDHMHPRCLRTASSWRPRRPHCIVTALPLQPHCIHTGLIQIAVGTPSHGAHFVHAQSAGRGMASYETPRRLVEMPRRSLGALGDLTVRTSAFWVFLARRAVATLVWQGLKQHQALCIISSSLVNSNWSYGSETVKWGCDLCDLDLLHGHHFCHW